MIEVLVMIEVIFGISIGVDSNRADEVLILDGLEMVMMVFVVIKMIYS